MSAELRGDAEKTFDVEQAAAEGREFEREYLAEAAAEADRVDTVDSLHRPVAGAEFEAEYRAERAEQATRPTLGAAYDITIRGAVLCDLPDPEDEPGEGLHSFTYTRPAGTDPEWMLVNLGSPDVSIAPAAPRHWPPLVGELWGGYTGIGTYTVLLAVDAQAAIGEPAEALVADSGASYSPAAARHQFTSLHRVYPDRR